MSHATVSDQNYTYNTRTTPYNVHNYSASAYNIFAFSTAVLLIGLGLRIIFALLVVTHPFARGLTVYTDPFVTPYTKIFHDSHGMVQPATALAFSTYYVLYWLVSMSHRLYRRRTTHAQVY